jgi:hypothetical protein
MFSHISNIMFQNFGDWDSVVGLATRYLLGGPWFEPGGV